eukprot:3234617-Lingulodinium_polyedra.AAC.1
MRVGEASHPGFAKLAQPPVGLRRRAPHAPLDFKVHRGLKASSVSKRGDLLREFSAWLAAVGSPSLKELLPMGPAEADKYISEYGQYAYDNGLSLHAYSETIN